MLMLVSSGCPNRLARTGYERATGAPTRKLWTLVKIAACAAPYVRMFKLLTFDESTNRST